MMINQCEVVMQWCPNDLYVRLGYMRCMCSLKLCCILLNDVVVVVVSSKDAKKH